ncbi:YdiU family protein [Polynucleobacter tropicus]|uniref:Protein nucleotidyltransferase YdiU n=1 Tax=Polynucleobacter tropicus TaxID=1743174 RepID=A0A6M9Q097_9BURK|nr:YdiU family protein [Polynucleobacter tropicus]QKM64667.1 YdiU family protein [Polynucleobacter tropicus]
MAYTLSGDDACQITQPSPIPNPYWVAFSSSAAKLIDLELGPNGLPVDPAWLEICAGNSLSTSTHQFTNPLSTVYSGHQFGVWAGQLGDGRAILLGDINSQELQLKGAGKTRYSRMGDGRAVLRSSIREFLCSEAMHSLGIPTTRALSVVGSEMPVRRESIETAAVCTRLASSFLRIGHFEHFASLQDVLRLKELGDLLIRDHYPKCQDTSYPYLELFKQICDRNAKLVAQWQAVGFCHGVLNSDNISAIGLTMDYGPFGFMDQFQIDHICNHSDQGGRYAYHRQPQIMHWNMVCLASAFIPLLGQTHDTNDAQTLLREALEEFAVSYAKAWQSLFRQKLGLTTAQDGDIHLIERLLQAMHESRVDFTHLFRQLGQVRQEQKVQTIALRDHFMDRELIDQWLSDYINRLKSENSSDKERQTAMNLVNPKFVLRNHLAQVAIDKAKQHDFSEIQTLLKILANPYDEQVEYDAYAMPPPLDIERVEVSCSS